MGVAWHKDEQYCLPELQPLVAIIKHPYWKGKCNILGEGGDEVLGEVEFFMENIQIYNWAILCYMYPAVLMVNQKKVVWGYSAWYKGNDGVTFVTPKWTKGFI